MCDGANQTHWKSISYMSGKLAKLQEKQSRNEGNTEAEYTC